MSKATKRTLSLIFCLAMAAAMFCAPAFAVGEEDVHDGHDCAEHEVVAVDTELPALEQALPEVGIVTTANPNCLHTDARMVDYGIVKEGTADHLVYVKEGGTTGICSYTKITRYFQYVCRSCGYGYVDKISDTIDHTICPPPVG